MRNAPTRRRLAIFLALTALTAISTTRVLSNGHSNIRAVEFLSILSLGMMIAVAIMTLVQLIREKQQPK